MTDREAIPLAYKDVQHWFDERDSERAAYRATMLAAALDEQGRPTPNEPDEHATAFHQYVWQIAHQEFPELGMNYPDAVRPDGTWIRFNPLGPFDQKLVYKMEKGRVDMEFRGAADHESEFRETYRGTSRTI